MIEARTPEKVAAELRSSHIEALSGILAIDGKDGSGKSCLARNLRKIIGGDIVVLDDFLTQKSKGRYVPYLDLPSIRAAIEGCARPTIVEGCCVLEVLSSLGYEQDALIYAKRVMFFPDGSFYWVDDDLLHHEKAVSENDTLTKEIIQYHDAFNPLHRCTIVFPHTYKKDSCRFHL